MNDYRVRALAASLLSVLAVACGSGDGGASGGASGTGGRGGSAGTGADAATDGAVGQDAQDDGAVVDGSGGTSGDGGELDASLADGSGANDSGVEDTGTEGGVDATDDGATDGGLDASVDGSEEDADDGSTSLDGGNPDAVNPDGGDPDGGPLSLPACDAVTVVDGPIASAASLSVYGSYDPGPLMLEDERAFVFLAGSDMWMTASHGSAMTGAVPSVIAGASRLSAWRTIAGWNGVTYEKGGKVYGTTFNGAGFSSPVETPCTSGGYACEARPAGDGHLWVYTSGNFHEETPSGFENRGGGPVTPSQWDVDAQGTLIVLGSGSSVAGEVLVVWKLFPGAGGWTKAGALMDADVAAVDAQIEGGFQFGSNGLGALAADGSIHLFSDARCVGTGDHNKVQAYLRSTDGNTWQVETLPSADDLTDGLVTWRNVAFWAGDYERVRYVVMSSPQPTFDGYTWYYPDRRYDVIARCEDAQGQATFTRVASASHPGWTQRGFAGFSDWGVATLLSVPGLTQVY